MLSRSDAVIHLRSEAERCRRLSGAIYDQEMVSRLSELARSFDQRAERLENKLVRDSAGKRAFL